MYCLLPLGSSGSLYFYKAGLDKLFRLLLLSGKVLLPNCPPPVSGLKISLQKICVYDCALPGGSPLWTAQIWSDSWIHSSPDLRFDKNTGTGRLSNTYAGKTRFSDAQTQVGYRIRLQVGTYWAFPPWSISHLLLANIMASWSLLDSFCIFSFSEFSEYSNIDKDELLPEELI